MLQIGQTVRAEIANELVTVLKKLGEGGQGAVYLVESKSYGRKALKWYNLNQSTPYQKKSIMELIQHGIPDGEAGRRFIWPIELVTSNSSNQFGYLMDLIDTSRFAELGEVWSRIKPAPSMRTMCVISKRAAESYRSLHLDGFCYRDISKGNMMFDTQNGDVLICDNDNVGVNLQSESQVWGTLEYMAPELILEKAPPSTRTDLHSLAVLLFQLWVWHHPFHGQMEYRIRSWDLPAKKQIYGEDPVFIFDLNDRRNELPNDPEYVTPQRRWDCLPLNLKEMFTRAFTVGLHSPNQRVTEGEWKRLFAELEDCIVSCPHDRAENFWYEGAVSLHCWYCTREISSPPKLLIHNSAGRKFIVLNNDTIVLNHHFNPSADPGSAEQLVAKIVQNPNNPGVWGLRNLTDRPWIAEHGQEAPKEVPPQKAIPLVAGLKIEFSPSVKGEIYA
ncbi:hypothetical protein [Cohnella sp. GbtcB17]|uniref:protein kinase domain-containing protein n=1 Tax=Cohnella sp. GbtcB17 TaxID=2824762 RepID=UPI001C311963|nr:hypothetical protein [Cohnella sp. GbtcB17]